MIVCGLCGESVESVSHIAEQATLELIRRMNPKWVHTDGACPKCLTYYEKLDRKE